MINVNNASALVKTHENNKKSAMVNAVKRYCETVVHEEIKLRAEYGNEHTRMSIPTDLDVEMVMDYIRNAGFEVVKLTASYIYIEWSKKGE